MISLYPEINEHLRSIEYTITTYHCSEEYYELTRSWPGIEIK